MCQVGKNAWLVATLGEYLPANRDELDSKKLNQIAKKVLTNLPIVAFHCIFYGLPYPWMTDGLENFSFADEEEASVDPWISSGLSMYLNNGPQPNLFTKEQVHLKFHCVSRGTRQRESITIQYKQ